MMEGYIATVEAAKVSFEMDRMGDFGVFPPVMTRVVWCFFVKRTFPSCRFFSDITDI